VRVNFVAACGKCLIDSLLFGVVKGEGKNRNLLSARTRA